MTTDLRCAACGSLVRPGADWCSLCHVDLRAEKGPHGRHARPSSGPAVTETSGVELDPDAALARAGVDVASVLEMLAADQDRPFRSVADRLSTKGQRVAVVTGAMALLVVVGVAAMFALGSMLH